MKRKITFIICLIFLSAVLFSCGKTTDQGVIMNPSEYDCLNDVVEVVFTGNKAALLDMFSQNAKKEAITLEDDVDRLISYALCDGVPNKVELDYVGGQISKKKDDGKKLKEYTLRYYVKTNTKTFYISLDYCSQNTFEEGNVGITKLILMEKDGKDANDLLLSKWYRTEVPGAYVPE